MRIAKNIVARHDLCRCIPEGYFANSVFVWDSEGVLVLREGLFGTPAPTLSEIMQDLRNAPKMSIARCCCGPIVEAFTVSAQNERGTCSYCTYIEENPSDAMLELWLELKGVKR